MTMCLDTSWPVRAGGFSYENPSFDMYLRSSKGIVVSEYWCPNGEHCPSALSYTQLSLYVSSSASSFVSTRLSPFRVST